MNRAAGRSHGGNFGASEAEIIARWSQRFAPLIAERDRLMRGYMRGKRALASFRPLPGRPPAGFASPEAYVASLSVELTYSRLGEEGIRADFERLAVEVRSLRGYVARRGGDPREGDRWQSADLWDRWIDSADSASRPYAVTPVRAWARDLLKDGYGYYHAVWLLAYWVMMGQPPLETVGRLTRQTANQLKKALDRAWDEQSGSPRPRLPRAWWKPVEGDHLALEWYPREQVAPGIRSERPIMTRAEVDAALGRTPQGSAAP